MLAYSGRLSSPEGMVSVFNIRLEELLSLEVGSDEVDIAIFVNDAIEPDRVEVVVSCQGRGLLVPDRIVRRSEGGSAE